MDDAWDALLAGLAGRACGWLGVGAWLLVSGLRGPPAACRRWEEWEASMSRAVTDAPGGGPGRYPDLTEPQAALLGVLRDHAARYGQSPTLREAAAALGVPVGGRLNNLFCALEHKGYIHRDARSWRGVTLTEKGVKG
jgi:hypothetical protein